MPLPRASSTTREPDGHIEIVERVDVVKATIEDPVSDTESLVDESVIDAAPAAEPAAAPAAAPAPYDLNGAQRQAAKAAAKEAGFLRRSFADERFSFERLNKGKLQSASTFFAGIAKKHPPKIVFLSKAPFHIPHEWLVDEKKKHGAYYQRRNPHPATMFK